MIRLIQRRLIIPRGDTGSFFIPTIVPVQNGDVAVFSILDPLTKQTVLEKIIPANQDYLNFTLTYKDTINLTPKKYKWDVKIYNYPKYEDEILVGGIEVHSYYGTAYSLPICEIKEVSKNV